MFQSLTLPPAVSPLQFSTRRTPRVRCTATVRGSARPSLYDLLRLNRDASLTEIKAAYRRLAKQHHPDAASHSHGSDARDFIQIRQAYDTLSDPTARALYDMSLALGVAAGPRPSLSYYPTRTWETDQCW